jgi:hypothetical protein
MLKSWVMLRHLMILSVLVCAFAHADDVENKAYYLCKHKKQVRTVRVTVSSAGICATLYSKEGEEKVVGSGKNHESCMNFMNNIKTNLEKSNWTCRDISTARVSASQ